MGSKQAPHRLSEEEPSRKPLTRFEGERHEMIELLRKRGIRDERLLKAMASIDRREFVHSPFVNRAYEDSALPIGDGQTISQPFTVAYMTEALEVNKGDKILEIGTGSGYQAAILAEMGARVFTIERHMDLLTEARKRFDKFGYQIASKCGDGTIGWKEFSPFDGIIVTAGAPDVPRPLLDQLRDGGMLIIPIGDTELQTLYVIKRIRDNFETRETAGFKFVPLIGKKGWK
ncbi:MAG: protein-L-isoaspartate(D-aspartate) O-methyltransferase [Ignavibacteria bacterium]|nr:protein-L-isoaspartate(D-aspartate) O-methyltransferase [Ignavibacteria bacterium]MBI3766215.1 protein-L-isoaspartate(D-aspartate) O-methyltransferase [Ignavibacteriales bacterium]